MKNVASSNIHGKPSIIDQAKAAVGAVTQHAIDRDEMLRIRRMAEARLWKLKRRMPTTKRRRGRRKKMSWASSIYTKTIEEYESIIKLLTEAITTHEKILLASRRKESRVSLQSVLQFFAEHINKLCSKWHVFERWHKGVVDILKEIKRNAENLPSFKLAPG